MKTLKVLFLEELTDMYDAEHRIAKALPKLAKAATCNDLKGAFRSHLKETQSHLKKIEKIFEIFEEKATGKTCEATVGLLEEVDEIAAKFKGSPALDAALIAAAQKVEHYEIASYGCLNEWAGLMANSDAAKLITEILDEEKAADRLLTELARASSNVEALGDDDAKTMVKSKPKVTTPRRRSEPAKPSRRRGQAGSW